MRKERSALVGIHKIFLLSIVCFLIFSLSFGQNHKFLFFGFGVDNESNPITGMDIILKDIGTGRNYWVKKDSDGKSELFGLPQRFEEAIPELVRATELAPKFIPAYQQLRFCFKSLKQIHKALENCKKLAELDQSNATNLYNLGLILFKMERMDAALNYLEQSIRIKPDEWDTLGMTARYYVQKEDLPKAIEYSKKARALAQNEGKVKYFETFISSKKAQIKR